MADLGATPIGYYTPAEVGRLAGVSAHRIGQWARYGIILPSVSRRPNVYSYADAGEAVLAHYLVEQGLSPGDVRRIVHRLRDEYGPWPLARAPLKHDGRLAVIQRKDGIFDVVLADEQGEQGIMLLKLFNLKDIRQALSRGGWVSYENPREFVEVDPDLHSGEPVIRGRRITTSRVAALAALPDGRETLREDFDLTDAEIDDAVGYEHDLMAIAA
jgi:uncharacterized protein (DUF433 family)/DNA-binding transcriptional MerR regulator